ncbi:tubulin binding cofactor E [Tieghemostelium lacteum]|uniref:Tubulin binding cofactor E n=1 Tax=Tieghemostelium lacteum TaxID=361077 RepID=A0A151Z6Z0_TIELA|nr:tubulin binding cofactor E [Tieghemostelium lacteum]|eukprot:KYQ89729.1 tubulin binding cofactor E [Tieghemostelium lacteum]
MTLPNHIAQKILELFINKLNDVYYLIGCIRKLTSVSSRWNREIIPKLVIHGYPTSCLEFNESNNHVISDWVKLAERYQLSYQVDLKFKEFDDGLQYVDSIKDRVESCAIINTYKEDCENVAHFKNLKRVELEKYITYDLKIDLKPMDNVNCELDLSAIEYQAEFDTDEEDEENDLSFHIDKQSMDVIFNQNIFSVVKVNYNITINDMVLSIGNTKLTDLVFEQMSIRCDTLSHIIEKSQNLKRISLSSIHVDDSDSFDRVLDEMVRLTQLQDISFKLKGRVTFDKLISFINETKANNLYLDFGIVEVGSSQSVMESSISNNSIQSFYFGKITFHPITYAPQDFTLFDIWKTKSSLWELYISTTIDISIQLRYMVHVEKVTFVNQDEYQDTNSIENIILLNLPKLKYFILEKGKCCPKINPLLSSNSFISILDLQNGYYNDLIQILNHNHPTLTTLITRYLSFNYMDNLQDLFESIANNKTIPRLAILRLGLTIHQLENYPVKYINQILLQNKTLQSLIMATFDFKLDIDNFESALSSNTVIQYLGLYVDQESLHKISKICSSQNVVFVQI